MAFLIDTTILARLANAKDVQHAMAARSVLELHRRGETLHLTPQVLIEFRNVATRPPANNGLGLVPADVDILNATYETRFPLLDESPAIYPAWKLLVSASSVIGNQVHDARLVAICQVHNLSHVLTFNVGHFTRPASFARGLTVVDPTTI